jgi:long-chain acyl-CoA synthetase
MAGAARLRYVSSIGVSVTDEESLTDMVWANAERFADVVSFRHRVDHSWLDVTAGELATQVLTVAKGLIGSGLRTGERVTSLCANGYEWAVAEFAIWAAGCVSVPGERAVLEPDGLARLAESGRDVGDEALHARRLAVGADDPATGEATHRDLLIDVRSTIATYPRLLGTGNSMLIRMPMTHPFARVAALCAIYTRTTLAIGPDADLGAFRPTVVVAEPALLNRVYQTARARAHTEDRGRLFDVADGVAVEYARALEGLGPSVALRGKHAMASRFVYPKVRAALGGRCTAVLCTGEPPSERLRHFFRGVGIPVHSV